MWHHRKLATRMAVLITVGLSGVAFIPPDIPNRPSLIGLCFILGTMYAFVTSAGAWMAFGPLHFLWRLPLSLIGILCFVVAFSINIAINGGPGWEFSLLLGACLLAQWFVVQLPLWALGLAYGLRLQHPDQLHHSADLHERQFGIRELLIFTTIIAVILGIGRALLSGLPGNLFGHPEVGTFVFLAVAGMLVSLPVLIAGLLPRYSGSAVLIGLAVVALATMAEFPLLKTLVATGGGPEAFHLLFLNTFTSSWILAYVYVIRRAGYRLGIASLRSERTA